MELSAASATAEIKKFELPIGFLGFWAGVDQKYIGSSGPGTTYPYSKQGFGDMLASIGGQGLAHAVIPDWSGGATRTFKITAPISNNKALVPLVGLVLADKFAGQGFGVISKVIRVVADAGVPFGIGWSLGTIFDSDSPGNEGNSGGGSTYGRNALAYNGQQVLP